MQLKLVSTVVDNKKGFLKYANSERRTNKTLVHYLIRLLTSQIEMKIKQRHLMPSLPLSLTAMMGPGMP